MLPLPLAGSAQCSFHPASAMWRCDTCGKGPEVQGRKETQKNSKEYRKYQQPVFKLKIFETCTDTCETKEFNFTFFIIFPVLFAFFHQFASEVPSTLPVLPETLPANWPGVLPGHGTFAGPPRWENVSQQGVLVAFKTSFGLVDTLQGTITYPTLGIGKLYENYYLHIFWEGDMWSFWGG